MTIHSAAVLIMAFVGTRIRVQLETRRRRQWNLIAIQICATALIGLLLAVLHGIECGIWAAAYLWLGAIDSPTDALLYSIDSMATLGASGLTLQRPWQLMGGQWDDTVRCEHGVRFRGDAAVLVNACQVRDP
jgi:hypothetical protein